MNMHARETTFKTNSCLTKQPAFWLPDCDYCWL